LIFCYWTTGEPPHDHQIPAAGVAAWKERFPDFTVFSDEHVMPLLEEYGEDAIALYRSIRIPACRSDIARLLLLRAHGGVYIDAHCAPGASGPLTQLLSLLSGVDLVVFDESVDSPEYRHTCIINGILGARVGAPVLDVLIRRALIRLDRHRRRERLAAPAHVPYSIYKLTGPWIIWHELFHKVPVGADLKPHYCDRVAIWPWRPDSEQRPIVTSRHSSYHTPVSHWSEREKHEPLFRC
jgi:hypothetical protein